MRIKLWVIGVNLALLGLPAHGTNSDTWIKDANGCKVFDPYPQPNETVSWSGTCKNGFAEGQGQLQWVVDGKQSTHIEGTLRSGKLSGKVSTVSANGVSSERNYVEGAASGRGVMTWPDGGRYEGDWINGDRTGVGVFTRSNGDRYEGEFVNGNWSGKGVWTKTDGSRYDGDWVENKREGRGTYTFPDGRRYEGEFHDGKLSGKGLLISTDGSRYDGDWVDNKREGRGTYLSADGSQYQGEFHDGKLSGKGLLIWSDGSHYEGQFIEGKPAKPNLIVHPTYSISKSVLGSHIAAKEVYGIQVPPGKTYAELTPEEKRTVKSLYEPMAEGDEPPYPLHGLRKILSAAVELSSKHRVDGLMSLAVTVNSEGKAISVEVFKSTDKEMTKAMATVLMLEKWKPAVCSGSPCQMQYPFRMRFDSPL